MRVLFFFHTPWINGGASKSGLTLVKGLKDRGVDVVAVCPEEDTLSDALRKSGIEVAIFHYDWAYPYFDSSLKGLVKYVPKLAYNGIKNRLALGKLTKWAQSFGPDIIHTNSCVADIGLRLAKRLGVPHITHFREFGWKDCNAVMLHERGMRRYPKQHGIAISKDILEWHTRPGDDNTLIYNGILADNITEPKSEREPWWLYVGGLYREKGIEDLMEAYSMLDESIRKSHRLKIAGSAVYESYMKSLEALALRLGIAADIDWLGEVADVDRLMQRAGALVVPSHNEAFGRIVVEGMANGCPVIGRDCAGIKEQFDNGLELTSREIGLRFQTIGQLKSILEHLAAPETEDPMELRAMTSAARKAAVELYSIGGYIEKVKGLYEKIINA